MHHSHGPLGVSSWWGAHSCTVLTALAHSLSDPQTHGVSLPHQVPTGSPLPSRMPSLHPLELDGST